jgi:hypothetical protein
MGLYNIASDLNTRETVWVSRNVVKGRQQLNSHREDDFGRCYQREGIDGFSAVEIAGLATEYYGNGWEEKYNDFVARWGVV